MTGELPATEPITPRRTSGYGVVVAIGLFIGFIVGIYVHNVTVGTLTGGLIGAFFAALASWRSEKGRQKWASQQPKSGDQSTPPDQ